MGEKKNHYLNSYGKLFIFFYIKNCKLMKKTRQI